MVHNLFQVLLRRVASLKADDVGLNIFVIENKKKQCNIEC
jgi:hypothetical protein